MNNPSDHEMGELTIFSAARRLAPRERAAYLDGACADDSALRQRVEELLDASEEAGVFLQRPTLAMAHHQLKQSQAAHTALAKGMEIMDKKMPDLNLGDSGGSWVDWIIAKTLLDEARALVDTK
jgi:hypothetical protein